MRGNIALVQNFVSEHENLFGVGIFLAQHDQSRLSHYGLTYACSAVQNQPVVLKIQTLFKGEDNQCHLAIVCRVAETVLDPV